MNEVELEYLSTINLYNDRDLVSFDYLNQYAGRTLQLYEHIVKV